MAGMFDPYYVMEVLADILGREQGCTYKVVETPPESSPGQIETQNDG